MKIRQASMPWALRSAAAGTALAAGLLGAAPAEAKIKIGFIATFTGPNAILGAELLDGFNLAVREDNHLGTTEVEMVTADDEQNPETGRQAAERLIEREHVDLMVGVAFPEIMQAVADPVLERGLFLFGPNAAPSDLAGQFCHPNFFAMRGEDHESHEVMGQYATDQKVKRVYLLAPDSLGGREAIEGFRRFYKGEVVGETLTPLLPDNGKFDYAPALKKIRPTKPTAIYAFYPGGLGIAFLTQYVKAEMTDIPLLGSSDTLGETVLQSVSLPALDAKAATLWSESLPNPENRTFVAAFRQTYNRAPSAYAAQGYDTARLIAAALDATNGSVADKAAFRAAVLKADFGSVRGSFHFGTNQFPIQPYRLGQVTPGENGTATLTDKGVLQQAHADAYSAQCRMKKE